MDKPPKQNTVSEVIRRIGHSIDSLLAIREVEPRHGQLLESFTTGISSFFSEYGILLPLSINGTEGLQGNLPGELERILGSRGQEALDAIEGVTRLATKVVWYTHEDESRDPGSYVGGLFEVLSGLPLVQLGSTPNKSQVPLNQRTSRDRISDLLSIGKGQTPGQKYMLNLLYPEMLPAAAARVKAQGQEKYVRFMTAVLDYVHSLAMGLIVNSEDRIGMIEVGNELLHIEGEVNTQPEKLTQEALVRFAGLPDPKTALEHALGGRIIAVDYSSHVSGVNRTASFFVTADGLNPVKHSVRYGSSRVPPQVVGVLLRIQQECSSSLSPSDPLYQTNSAAGRNIPYLSAGQNTRFF